jgi:hypothetical protein
MTIRAIERIGIALALVPEAETSFTVTFEFDDFVSAWSGLVRNSG